MPFVERVLRTEYRIAVNLALSSLSEPKLSPRPIAESRMIFSVNISLGARAACRRRPPSQWITRERRTLPSRGVWQGASSASASANRRAAAFSKSSRPHSNVRQFGKNCPQARRLRPQRGFVACRAADFLRFLLGLAQPAPAGLEMPLPIAGMVKGEYLRLAQLFAMRFSRIRPRPLLFIQGFEIARRDRRCRSGRRPNPGTVLVRRRAYGNIIVQDRHSLHDSAGQVVLSNPLRGLDSMSMIARVRWPIDSLAMTRWAILTPTMT